jgi:CRISPR-associated protein Cas2
MLAVICYDISSNRQRARLHRVLKEYGLNTQKSIFECEVDRSALLEIVREAQQLINPETDSFRIYRICAQCQKQVVVSGLGLKVENLDFMIC